MTFLYYQRCFYKQTLENTEGVIKNGESQETGNIGYTRHRTNKRQRIPKWQSKMDNPEKLATQGTQDEEKQSTNRTQYVLDTTLCHFV